MKLNRLFILGVICSLFFASCVPDDDLNGAKVVIRDKAEQALADDDSLVNFLQTHFYNYEDFANPPAGFDNKVRIDSIAGENEDKTPIWESPLLETKTITRDEIDYNLYVLKVREGEGQQPTFADSVFVTYRGQTLNLYNFDSAITPVWFDLTSAVVGFTEAVVEFKGATGFVVNSDNSVEWNDDYGIGAVFLPSGLGYYAAPPTNSGIAPYSPLVFGFEMYGVHENDHDGDGVPSYMEDIDGDRILSGDAGDDTDGDLLPNYADADDDGDGIPTRDEIVIEVDGTLSFPDTDNDGTPDYLDPDN